ncbi:hypothetical protein QTP88_011925 [Uroleucon formosanum]
MEKKSVSFSFKEKLNKFVFFKPKVEQNETINKRKRELSIDSSSSMYTKNNKMQTTSTSLSSSCSFSNPEIPHSKPLKNFSKLTGKNDALKTHGNHKYHKFAVKSRNNFLPAYHNPQKVIINQINTQRSIQVNENRKRLVPIIETIIFCGRQNLALKGHRDDGFLDDDAGPSNEENFRELLMFRISAGDKTLESHINTTSSRSTFIILRYVLDNKVHEDFITFVDAYKSIRPEDIPNPYEVKLSGKALGHVVLDIISKLGLDLDKCIGIGTDGAAIQKKCCNAVRCPCFNHALNNSLAQASTIPSIRNTIGTLKAIIAFFKTFAKKHKLLTDTIGHKLIGLCQTRWVELHDCIIQFKKILPQLESSMTTSKAKSFVLSICGTDFIFALTCLSFMLERTLPLSKILQSTTIDLKNASEIVQCTITVLQSNRTNCISESDKLYIEVQQLASELDIDLKLPRIIIKQTHRKNYNSQSIDEYYRISMFIPLLDSIIEDLKRRFTLPSIEAYDLSLFIQKTFLQQKMYCTSDYRDRVLNVSKRFYSIEPNKLHGETILGELKIWCQKWKLIAEGVEKCLNNAIETFFFL